MHDSSRKRFFMRNENVRSTSESIGIPAHYMCDLCCVCWKVVSFFFSAAAISRAHRLLCAWSQWQRFFGKSHILKLAHDLGEMHCVANVSCRVGDLSVTTESEIGINSQLNGASECCVNAVMGNGMDLSPFSQFSTLTADQRRPPCQLIAAGGSWIHPFRHAKLSSGSHERVVRTQYENFSRLCRTAGDAMR